MRDDLSIAAGLALGEHDAVIFGVLEIAQFVHEHAECLFEFVHLYDDEEVSDAIGKERSRVPCRGEAQLRVGVDGIGSRD